MHRNMHSDMKSQVGMNEGGSRKTIFLFFFLFLHMEVTGVTGEERRGEERRGERGGGATCA